MVFYCVTETIEPYFEVTEGEPGSELQAGDLTAEVRLMS